jgi:regulator of protease activity HflC (stomatin/prohibitin superfamily)
MTTSIAEVPVDDREVAFVIHGRSVDFQDVVVQGAAEFRIVDPIALASRVDFTLDLRSGSHTGRPLERIDGLLKDLVQRIVVAYLVRRPLSELLENGLDELCALVQRELVAHEPIADMGLAIQSVSVKELSPEPEVGRALQAKQREAIQQQADEATFERRALAVEKERAIGENELQSQIELARREEQLIAQRGDNERRRAADEVDSQRIQAEGKAERRALDGRTDATRIHDVEGAKVAAERDRMAVYREMPAGHLYALAAQRFAEKLERIDQISITPDTLGRLFQEFAQVRSKVDQPVNPGSPWAEGLGDESMN